MPENRILAASLAVQMVLVKVATLVSAGRLLDVGIHIAPLWMLNERPTYISTDSMALVNVGVDHLNFH